MAPVGLKLLTRLSVCFSHLQECKCKHNFNDTLNPRCFCSIETESITHYSLRCHFYNEIRTTLMNELRNIDDSLPALNQDNLKKLLLYGNYLFGDSKSLL